MEVIDRRISFNAGEISTWLDPRIDLEKYHAGCRQLENLRPSIYGGAIRRAGTEYKGAALTASTAVRLIPFLGGNGTDYVLEFSDEVIRVWDTDTAALVPSTAEAAWLTATAYSVGQILSEAGANYEVIIAHTSGTFATDLAADKLRLYPYIEISSVYMAGDLNAIQYGQQNDVMYLTHPDYAPQVLLRQAADDWICGPAKFDWPVTLGPNTTRISILPWANAYVDTWDSGASYVVGNHVLSGGLVYRNILASTNHVPPNASYWTVTTWSNGKVYVVDTVILYSGQYYVAKSAHTAATGREPGTTAGETYYAKANRIDAIGQGTPDTYFFGTVYAAGALVTYNSLYYVRTSWAAPFVNNIPPTGDAFSLTAWDQVNVSPTGIAASIPKGESITLESSESLFAAGHVGTTWVIAHRRPEARVFFNAATAAVGYTSDPLYVLGAWTGSTQSSIADPAMNVVIHIERSTDLVNWEFYSTLVALPITNNQILTGTEDEPAFLRLKLFSKTLSAGVSLTVDLIADNGTQYGLAQVTGYTSATKVTATVITPLYSYDRTTRWEEPAFTSVRGFPRAVAFHNGRLWFGGITARPTSVWGSTVDAYWDFRTGSDDDRALAYTVASDESSTIEWLVSQDMLCIGTTSGEWTLGQRPGDDEIRLRRNTSFGSAPIQGRAIGDALVYVQKSRRKLREFAFNFERDGFLSNDLNQLAEHLGDAEMLQIALQRNPESVVWVVTTRGDLLLLTYERTQNVAGWCRYTTNGTFESVAIVPGDQEEDHVWLCVVRPLAGVTARYIERIAPDMIRALKDGEESELIFSDSALVLNTEGTGTDDVEVSGLAVSVPTLGYDVDVLTRPSYSADGGNYTLAAELPKASGTLNPTGTNNEIFIEAVTGGTGGNSITVEIVAAVQAATTVAVVGNEITITAGTKAKMTVSGTINPNMNGVCYESGIYESFPYYKTAGSTGDPDTGLDDGVLLYVTGDQQWIMRNYTAGVSTHEWLGDPVSSAPTADLSDWSDDTGSPLPTGNPVITASAYTAAECITAINASGAASALVTASNASGSTGAGTVAAVGPITLTGGSATPRWRLTAAGSTWLGASTETYPWDILPGDWSAVSPATGTPTIQPASSTITGLDHLEGEEVVILADGASHPARTVSGGEITLEYSAQTAVVGLAYDAIIEPTYMESRNVAEFSKVGKKRIHSLTAEFWKTAGIEISADGGTTWTPMETRTPLDQMDSFRSLFTGLREEKLDGRTTRQASIIVRATDPLPMALLSMNIRYQLNTTT